MTDKNKPEEIIIDQNATAEEILNFINNKNTKGTEEKNKTMNVKLDEEDKRLVKELSSSIEVNDEGSTDKNNVNEKESVNAINKEEAVERLSSDPTINFEALFGPKTKASETMFVDTDKITVDEQEKEIYLRSILENKRFELKLETKASKITTLIQSKLIDEQDYITNYLSKFALETDSNGKLMHSTEEYFRLALKLNIIFGIRRLNNIDFFDSDKYNNNELDRDQFVEKALLKLKTMPKALWIILVNSVLVFERKENLLSKMILNEDF